MAPCAPLTPSTETLGSFWGRIPGSRFQAISWLIFSGRVTLLYDLWSLAGGMPCTYSSKVPPPKPPHTLPQSREPRAQICEPRGKLPPSNHYTTLLNQGGLNTNVPSRPTEYQEAGFTESVEFIRESPCHILRSRTTA